MTFRLPRVSHFPANNEIHCTLSGGAVLYGILANKQRKSLTKLVYTSKLSTPFKVFGLPKLSFLQPLLNLTNTFIHTSWPLVTQN